MNRLFFLLLLMTNAVWANSTNYSLINHHYIARYLTHYADWANDHCASGDYLGLGMLYYSLAYIKKAQFCVCLGSGGGFVPRVMKQAQRDLRLKNARTILVDGNIGNYGRPQWLSNSHFFRREFPDVEILIDLTHNVAQANPSWKIDYLHIDADHSFDGAYRDFQDFLPLMSKQGVITFHDTKEGGLPCAEIIPLLKNQGYEIVNLKEFGSGVAIIYLH